MVSSPQAELLSMVVAVPEEMAMGLTKVAVLVEVDPLFKEVVSILSRRAQAVVPRGDPMGLPVVLPLEASEAVASRRREEQAEHKRLEERQGLDREVRRVLFIPVVRREHLLPWAVVVAVLVTTAVVPEEVTRAAPVPDPAVDRAQVLFQLQGRVMPVLQ